MRQKSSAVGGGIYDGSPLGVLGIPFDKMVHSRPRSEEVGQTTGGTGSCASCHRVKERHPSVWIDWYAVYFIRNP